jgi:hypothetical protein
VQDVDKIHANCTGVFAGVDGYAKVVLGMLDLTFKVLEGGKMSTMERKAVISALTSRVGRFVRIRIDDPTRSTNANAFYWGCYVEPIRLKLREAAGKDYTKEQVHDWLKRTFWPIPADTYTDPDGVTITEYSTRKLSVEHFRSYLLNISTSEYVTQGLELWLDNPEQHQQKTGQKVRGHRIYEDAA